MRIRSSSVMALSARSSADQKSSSSRAAGRSLLQPLQWRSESCPDMLDGELIQQALSGDQEAFAILVKRYHASISRFIFSFLKDASLADDILQQVFLQLYLSLPTLRTDRSVKAWLFQVARHCCMNELRRKRPIRFSEVATVQNENEEELPPFATILDPDPLPEEVVELHEMQRSLHEAIQTLPPRLRSVVWLRYTAQLSFSEVGQKLSIPAATAKTYFYRARPLLRALLEVSLEVTPISPKELR
jgi:RNA polymerase sigma factor (sigma-70 family)